MSHFRERLRARGVLAAAELKGARNGSWVRIAGAVIVRQRPGTAKGFLFLTLEDETGLANVIVRPDLFEREKAVLVSAGILEVEGILQNREGTSVRAFAVRAAGRVALTPSRDFR
jgi:error-prone DNA polymerase